MLCHATLLCEGSAFSLFKVTTLLFRVASLNAAVSFFPFLVFTHCIYHFIFKHSNLFDSLVFSEMFRQRKCQHPLLFVPVSTMC